MTDEPVPDDAVAERVAIAMLTLRVATPAGEWLNDENERLYMDLWREVEEEFGGVDVPELLVLTLVNLAWYAFLQLELATGRPAIEWLQTLVLEYQGNQGEPE